MLVPASTGSGESDLVSARLAEVLKIGRASCRERVEMGADTAGVVIEWLEMLVVREEATLTKRVTDLLAPLVIVVRFHPTTPAVCLAEDVIRTLYVTGVQTCALPMSVASDGPLFVTVSV